MTTSDNDRSVSPRPDGYRYTVPIDTSYESVSKKLGLTVEEVLEQLAREKSFIESSGAPPLPTRTQEPGQGSQP